MLKCQVVNPAGNLFNFNDLYTAKDGIWVTVTTANTFSFFSFATEKITTYQVPTPATLPLGLYVASNGVVYVAELVGNKILTFDPKTKKITEYPLSELAQFLTVIRAERDGYVYFSLFVGNEIGRINMSTHKIDLYHTNQLLLLGSEDTIDKCGGVWLSSFTTNVMSRLDTNTFDFSYVALQGTFAEGGASGVLGDIPPYVDIAVNYGPGDAVWFTSLTKNQVGRYNITGFAVQVPRDIEAMCFDASYNTTRTPSYLEKTMFRAPLMSEDAIGMISPVHLDLGFLRRPMMCGFQEGTKQGVCASRTRNQGEDQAWAPVASRATNQYELGLYEEEQTTKQPSTSRPNFKATSDQSQDSEVQW
ncbi:hypothetical protein DL95DRAFT_401564 [Leptodontidium sp. 2 PMI_412]|nr:hypothetical protein DL95DRAFT_401564 [Leptodontidium sp. 2 PMI_412]